MYPNEQAILPRTENKTVLRYNLLVKNEVVNLVCAHPSQEYFWAAISLFAYVKLRLLVINSLKCVCSG